jgi:hypothetical protein
MRDPHVRFCERHGRAISRAYSTPRLRGQAGIGAADCPQIHSVPAPSGYAASATADAGLSK